MFLSNYLIQQDGTHGTFRPADDIFEEASRKFQPSLQSSETDSSDLSNDVLRFASLKVVKDSLKRICDVKGNVTPVFVADFFQLSIAEITDDIVVYRLSLQRIVEYLRLKVARLAIPEVLEVSRTSIRRLAKDGLMEDGKETLLQGKCCQ
jgi:ribonuclease H2 subunit B